ncbi:unnamed protein product [Amoebophrya sp. A120]|nr:unnamed protein product [Amoebophrya sp. A120]|eukprot:GSA120T00020291001.1
MFSAPRRASTSDLAGSVTGSSSAVGPPRTAGAASSSRSPSGQFQEEHHQRKNRSLRPRQTTSTTAPTTSTSTRGRASTEHDLSSQRFSSARDDSAQVEEGDEGNRDEPHNTSGEIIMASPSTQDRDGESRASQSPQLGGNKETNNITRMNTAGVRSSTSTQVTSLAAVPLALETSNDTATAGTTAWRHEKAMRRVFARKKSLLESGDYVKEIEAQLRAATEALEELEDGQTPINAPAIALDTRSSRTTRRGGRGASTSSGTTPSVSQHQHALSTTPTHHLRHATASGHASNVQPKPVVNYNRASTQDLARIVKRQEAKVEKYQGEIEDLLEEIDTLKREKHDAKVVMEQFKAQEKKHERRWKKEVEEREKLQVDYDKVKLANESNERKIEGLRRRLVVAQQHAGQTGGHGGQHQQNLLSATASKSSTLVQPGVDHDCMQLTKSSNPTRSPIGLLSEQDREDLLQPAESSTTTAAAAAHVSASSPRFATTDSVNLAEIRGLTRQLETVTKSEHDWKATALEWQRDFKELQELNQSLKGELERMREEQQQGMNADGTKVKSPQGETLGGLYDFEARFKEEQHVHRQTRRNLGIAEEKYRAVVDEAEKSKLQWESEREKYETQKEELLQRMDQISASGTDALEKLNQTFAADLEKVQQTSKEELEAFQKASSEEIEFLKAKNAEELERVKREAAAEKTRELEKLRMLNSKEQAKRLLQQEQELRLILDAELESAERKKVAAVQDKNQECQTALETKVKELATQHTAALEAVQQNYVEKMEKQRAQFDTEMTERFALAEQLKANHVGELGKLRADCTAEIQALKADLALQHAAEVNDLKKQYAMTMEKMQGEHAERVTTTHSDHSALLQSKEADFLQSLAAKDVELAELKDAHEVTLDTMRNRHADEKEFLTEHHETKFSRLVEETETAKDAADERFRATTSTMASEHEEKLTSLERDHALALQELQLKADAEAASLVQTHKAGLQEVEQLHTKHLEAVKRDHAAAIEELEASHNTATRRLHDEYANTLDRVHEEQDARVKELRKEHETELFDKTTELSNQHAEKTKKLQNQHEEELTALEERTASDISQLKAGHLRTTQMLDQAHRAEIDTLREEHKAVLEELSIANGAVVEETEKRINKIEQELTEKVRQVQEAKNVLEQQRVADLADQRAQYESQLNDVLEEHEKEVSKVEKEVRQELEDVGRLALEQLDENLRAQFEEERAAFTEEYRKELEVERKKHGAEVQDVKKMFEDNVEEKLKDHELELEKLSTNHNARLQAEADAWAVEKAEILEKCEEKISALDAQVQRLRAQHGAEIESLKQETDQKVASLLDAKRAEWGKKEQDLLDKYEKMENENSLQLAKQAEQHFGKQQQFDEHVSRLKEDCDAKLQKQEQEMVNSVANARKEVENDFTDRIRELNEKHHTVLKQEQEKAVLAAKAESEKVAAGTALREATFKEKLAEAAARHEEAVERERTASAEFLEKEKKIATQREKIALDQLRNELEAEMWSLKNDLESQLKAEKRAAEEIRLLLETERARVLEQRSLHDKSDSANQSKVQELLDQHGKIQNDLQSENKRLKDRMEDAWSKIPKLEDVIAAKTSERASVEAKVQETEEKVLALETANAVLQKEVVVRDRKIEDLPAEVRGQCLDEFAVREKELQARIHELTTSSAAVREAVEQERSVHFDRLTQLRTDHAGEVQSLKTEHSQYVQSLRDEHHDQLRRNEEFLGDTMAQRLGVIVSNPASADEREKKQRESYEEKLARVAEDLAGMQKEKTNASTEAAQLRRTLQQKQDELSALEEVRDALEQRVRELAEHSESHISELREQSRRTKYDLELESQRAVDAKTAEVTHLSQELAQTKAELEEKTREAADASEQYVATNSELLQKSMHLETAQLELLTKDTSLQATNQELAQTSKDVEQLRTEVSRLFSENAKMQRDLDDKEAELRQKTAELFSEKERDVNNAVAAKNSLAKLYDNILADEWAAHGEVKAELEIRTISLLEEAVLQKDGGLVTTDGAGTVLVSANASATPSLLPTPGGGGGDRSAHERAATATFNVNPVHHQIRGVPRGKGSSGKGSPLYYAEPPGGAGDFGSECESTTTTRIQLAPPVMRSAVVSASSSRWNRDMQVSADRERSSPHEQDHLVDAYVENSTATTSSSKLFDPEHYAEADWIRRNQVLQADNIRLIGLVAELKAMVAALRKELKNSERLRREEAESNRARSKSSALSWW